MEEVVYRQDAKLSVTQFVDILTRSTLSERRPVGDLNRIGRMLDHGNILVTAWVGDSCVGVSRALSDFSFCCYLSDLAVDKAYQHRGIGKELIKQTRMAAGEITTLILLAAPDAAAYYPKIGMERFTDCFLIRRK
jgi:GNAT superfamily N-acetyltransferase